MAKDKLKSKSDATPKERKIPLRYVIPESQRPEYTNHVLVAQDQNSFYISFYHAQPPILLGTKEQIQKQMEGIEFLDAECISQLVMPKSLASDLLKVLAGQIERSSEAAAMKVTATNESNAT